MCVFQKTEEVNMKVFETENGIPVDWIPVNEHNASDEYDEETGYQKPNHCLSFNTNTMQSPSHVDCSFESVDELLNGMDGLDNSEVNNEVDKENVDSDDLSGAASTNG